MGNITPTLDRGTLPRRPASRSRLFTLHKTRAMGSKELSVELRDRIMLRHRSGEGYQKMSATLKVPKNKVAFIILKWKKFGSTKTLSRAGRLVVAESYCGDVFQQQGLGD